MASLLPDIQHRGHFHLQALAALGAAGAGFRREYRNAMFGGGCVDPADEFEGAAGEHLADAVLEGADVVAGQEVAGADRAAAASTGARTEFSFFG
jgi:hypothetical protein